MTYEDAEFYDKFGEMRDGQDAAVGAPGNGSLRGRVRGRPQLGRVQVRGRGPRPRMARGGPCSATTGRFRTFLCFDSILSALARIFILRFALAEKILFC